MLFKSNTFKFKAIQIPPRRLPPSMSHTDPVTSPVVDPMQGTDDSDVEVLSQQMANSLHEGEGDDDLYSSSHSVRSYGSAAGRTPVFSDHSQHSLHSLHSQHSQHSQHSRHSLHSPRASSDHLQATPPRHSRLSSESRESSESHESYGEPNERRRSIASIRIPGSICDAETYPLLLRRFWHPQGLLVPKQEYLSSIESQSKSFGMIAPCDNPESMGLTWSFVDIACLSDHLRRVIYFFSTIEAMSKHHNWNGFVVSTTNLQNNLQPRFAPGNKDVNGVLCCKDNDEAPQTSFRGARGVNINSLMSMGESNSSGPVYQSMPLLNIKVGFTGATYESSIPVDEVEDEPEYTNKHAVFCVVYVNWLVNVNFLPLVLVRYFFITFYLINSMNLIFFHSTGKIPFASQRQNSRL